MHQSEQYCIVSWWLWKTHLDLLFPLGDVAEGGHHEAVSVQGRHEVLPLCHGHQLLVSLGLGLGKEESVNVVQSGGDELAQSVVHSHIILFRCNTVSTINT
jgi:hypothetical protein